MQKNKLKNLKLIAFDFDGVFTDNTVYVDQDGRETVRCYRSDGIGLSRLKQLGLQLIVISTEVNPVVIKRCEKLGIPCINGCEDKLSALKKIVQEKNLVPEQVCFVGNDLPDIQCLNYVGFPIAVNDSFKEVLAVSEYTTKQKGGHGAVREVCDLIYESYNE